MEFIYGDDFNAETEENKQTVETEEVPAVETVSAPEATEENEQMSFQLVTVEKDDAETSHVDEVFETTETSGKTESNDIAFEIVKGIVKTAGSKSFKKLCLQRSKKCAMVCYKNRVVCTFTFGKQGEIVAVKFMVQLLRQEKFRRFIRCRIAVNCTNTKMMF